MNNQNNNVAAKSAWVRPAVSRVSAGAAEGGTGQQNDGIGNQLS